MRKIRRCWEDKKKLCLYKGESCIGKTFNFWKVISYHSTKEKQNGSAVMWLCECLKCGNRKPASPYNLFSGKSKSCFSCSIKNTSGCNNHNWKGYEEIPSSLITSYRNGAKARNIDFKITPKYLMEVWLNQNKKCALSGEDLMMRAKGIKKENSWSNSASLDRIDSNLGYIEGNVQWVHPIVNFMKNNFSQDLFVNFCKKISDRMLIINKEI
jgi:hypothetical protein